ncbi:hypothetical protein [[Eubacterium] hominis]|uniref:hypothetical protein n=1 Tax=[Eubacterium] hominis TaxID=2764325 RepID=UPI003A4DE0AD
MKKLLSLVFACALAFGTVVPIYASENVASVTSEELTTIKNGSMASLKGSENTFYALSVLADGADEASMKQMETTTLKAQEALATSSRASAQEVEKLILLSEGLGFDSTHYVLNGETVNLFTVLEGKTITLVNDYTFALEALYSAGYTPAKESNLNKDALIQTLLKLRNPIDQAWNYNADYSGSYGSSDPDTTAMVLSALAPYANQDAKTMGISDDTKAAVDAAVIAGFQYLSSMQGVSGAMDNGYGENASTTALTILAMTAYGKDVLTDHQFIQNGKSLLDGLMNYKNAENLGFEVANWQTGEMELNLEFSTEQGLRALVALQNSKVNTPYYLYQAGAFANENRKQQPIIEPEEKPVVTPQEQEKKEEPIIKDTAKQNKEHGAICLLLLVGAGVFAIRKYA